VSHACNTAPGGDPPPIEAARYLASRITNAELVILEGGALLTWLGNMDEMISVIDNFLGLETPQPEPKPLAKPKPASGGMVTILFTDIEGSTSLTQSVGDAAAQSVVRAHNTVVRDACSRSDRSRTPAL
jgi:hypothetical protein